MSETAAARDLSALLNESCHCYSVDRDRLQQELSRSFEGSAAPASLLAERPFLFSDSPVFIAEARVTEMASFCAALDRALSEPQLRARFLECAPAIAHASSPEHGVLSSADFHLTEDGPKLIEVNTNAGGILLNVALGRAQINCCDDLTLLRQATDPTQVEDKIAAMFAAEHHARFAGGALQVVAIVDDKPVEQYLYPEFLLFQRLFETRGIKCVIADAKDLEVRDSRLYYEGLAIDLVYNRLTDFYLDEPHHAALRIAFETGVAAFTPNPRNYALFAGKRNLTVLCDREALERSGVASSDAEQISRLTPRAVEVTEANVEQLWVDRKRWFFKPLAGHGGRGVYRGDKLTKRVFGEIASGGYIAQELALAPTRQVNEDTALKMDVRNFFYRGEVLARAVRLYQGQTTNFRTPGGGFAPLFVIPSAGT